MKKSSKNRKRKPPKPKNIEQGMQTLFHATFNIQYHLVLVTKYRRKVINNDIAKLLEERFKHILAKQECELIECNGEPDHMHLLISATPKAQMSKVVNALKGASARIVRKNFPEHMAKFYSAPVLYSRSYCLVSSGGAPLETIKAYINRQEGFDD